VVDVGLQQLVDAMGLVTMASARFPRQWVAKNQLENKIC
jgi:hypothetical protein